MPIGLDPVRVLGGEVAALREQPALAEMFLREVGAPEPWLSLPGWLGVSARLRGAPARQVLRLPHVGRIVGFDATPDGRRVAAVAIDGQVRVWTIAGDSATSVDLTGARGTFYKIEISDDGERVVAGGAFEADSRVWLWSVADGLVGELRGHKDAVLELAFRPDGRAIASTGMDGTLRVWDAATGAQQSMVQVATSKYPDVPDGGLMMSAAVSGLAWRPDGQRLATGDHTGKIQEWVVGQATPVTTLTGHTGDVGMVRYSDDGQRLVSSARDNSVRVWSPATGKLEHTFTAHNDAGDAVLSPDGRSLVTLVFPKESLLRDLESGHTTDLGELGWVKTAAFLRDGTQLVTTSGDVAALWRGHGRSGLARLTGHEGELLGARFTADGRVITVGSDDVRVWQVYRGTRETGSKRPYGLAVSADEKRVVVGGRGEGTRELEGERVLWSQVFATEAAAYSRDGGTIALTGPVMTGGYEVVVVRAGSGEVVRRWPVERQPGSFAFRGDGALAGLSLFDVVVWDAEGKELQKITSGDRRLDERNYEAMAWSPDGGQLAITTTAHEVLLWRMGQPGPDRSFSLADGLRESYERLEALAWSPDGTRLAVGAGAGTVFEYDVASLRLLGRWSVDPIDDLRYSPEGDRIHVIDIIGERLSVPAVRDPADIVADLWKTNRVCPTPAERVKWLNLGEADAAADHARCEAMLACIVAGGTAAGCVL